MNALLALVLTLVAFSAVVVVMIREPVRQAVALSIFGLLEALLFFIVQAPDVAFSQITVGGVAVPAMLFLAITKIRTQERAGEQASKEKKKDGR
jgi:uncharacterized MnhB-related membrane protein